MKPGCEATVPAGCPECADGGTAALYEVIVGDRLEYYVTHECATGWVETMGRDETPPPLRQALLDQCGTYRLRLTPGPGADRVRAMAVLRRSGVALTSARDFTGHGLPGTQAELELIARRLRSAGLAAEVGRDPTPGPRP